MGMLDVALIRYRQDIEKISQKWNKKSRRYKYANISVDNMEDDHQN